MRLQNNLYKIESGQADGYRVSLIADSIIYRAHFPEKPVTPGVCIIQIASELLGQLTGRNPSLVEVVNAKFLAVINPLETPEVTYTFSKLVSDDAAHTLKVQVVVTSEATICTKLSLLYNITD